MKISYAIQYVMNIKKLEKLLTFLFEHKRQEDQVSCSNGYDNATRRSYEICERFESKHSTEYKLYHMH